MFCNGSVYGNYRTRSFSEIFPNEETFLEEYLDAGIPAEMKEESAKTVFYLLYARYGNSHIGSSDETQFKYQVFSIMFSHGPTWERQLEIQKQLRTMSLDELQVGSKVVNNRAYNPGTAPSTDTLDEILEINEQTASKQKRSKVDALSLLYSLLQNDITTRFIDRFKVLFLKIVEPQEPLWYVTEGEE